MAEAGRTESLGEVLNLRQLLHYTVETLRLLTIGRAIRASVPREFCELSAGDQEQAWGFARMEEDDARKLEVRLQAQRRYLQTAIENEACALLDLHAEDLRYLDRLLAVWQQTRGKSRARHCLNELADTLLAGDGAMAVTVAAIEGEVEVQTSPIPPDMRRRGRRSPTPE